MMHYLITSSTSMQDTNEPQNQHFYFTFKSVNWANMFNMNITPLATIHTSIDQHCQVLAVLGIMV
jgi:hypothetical protein